MVDRRPENPPDQPPAAEGFRHLVVRKEQRKLRARREGDRGPWFWLGMFGLVGWSVAIPSLLGIAIGVCGWIGIWAARYRGPSVRGPGDDGKKRSPAV